MLPPGLVSILAEFLVTSRIRGDLTDARDIVNLARCCKSFYEVITGDQVLWKKVFYNSMNEFLSRDLLQKFPKETNFYNECQKILSVTFQMIPMNVQNSDFQQFESLACINCHLHPELKWTRFSKAFRALFTENHFDKTANESIWTVSKNKLKSPWTETPLEQFHASVYENFRNLNIEKIASEGAIHELGIDESTAYYLYIHCASFFCRNHHFKMLDEFHIVDNS